jgi:hypothetical protein
MPQQRAGWVSRDVEQFDSFGRRRVVPVRNYVDRKGFLLAPKFIFIDGRTGATLYREQYKEEVMYSAQQTTPALSSCFELMDRLVPIPERTQQPEDPRHARPLEVGRPFRVGCHYNYPITKLPDYPITDPTPSPRPVLKWAGGSAGRCRICVRCGPRTRIAASSSRSAAGWR